MACNAKVQGCIPLIKIQQSLPEITELMLETFNSYEKSDEGRERKSIRKAHFKCQDFQFLFHCNHPTSPPFIISNSLLFISYYIGFNNRKIHFPFSFLHI